MKTKILSLVGVLALMSACGSGTEPYGMLGDPTVNPQFSLPLASGTAFFFPAPYSTTIDGFELTPNAGVGTTNVLAPATGTVQSIVLDTSNNLYTVALLHNGRFSTRLSKLQFVTVQVGKFIPAGTVIGTTAAGGSVRLSVLRDGGTVCPTPYLDATALAQITAVVGGTNPCQAP